MMLDPAVVARIATDPRLWRDFETLCDFGGRLSGTPSEAAALAFGRQALAAIPAARCRTAPVPYRGWRALGRTLRLADGTSAACHPLVRTVATPVVGLEAEVIDLGRGTPEEYEAHRSEIAGRIVLVRHELMFAAGTIHRRRKMEMARDAGAVGFLIASPLPGSIVAGSSGRMDGDGIPAFGITGETAARLARRAGPRPRVTMMIETEEQPASTETIIADIPGKTNEWVVLSAHIDGHDVAESAMDNATGVAAVLSVARALAPSVGRLRRGLRVMLFSVEEWALTGSAHYVQQLDGDARAKIALNVNLDSIAGSANLTALTSGFAGTEPFLLKVAESNGHMLRTVRPFMQNSDHANFAAAGIPAFRLVAGYDEPMSNLKYVLTPVDTRDKVSLGELRQATLLAAAITAAACDADNKEAASWRDGFGPRP